MAEDGRIGPTAVDLEKELTCSVSGDFVVPVIGGRGCRWSDRVHGACQLETAEHETERSEQAMLSSH